MEIQWIENTAGFDTLHEEWDRLLADSSSDCVFLTWEWLRTWWSHLAERRQLRMAVVRSGGELIALAPLDVRPGSMRRLFPFRVVEFLGSGTAGSDYLDLIVRKGFETEALDALSIGLARRDLMLEFGQLRSSGSAAADLGRRLRQEGWKSAQTKVNTCPFIDLRGHSWTTYLATLGSQHRYDVQRKIKKISKQFEVVFERVENEEQREPALQLLIALHNQRWIGRGGSDAFHTAGHVAFHAEFTARALRRGWLRLYVLRLDGKPASALYGLRYKRTFYFYQSGFDPQYSRHSVGLVTMGLAIKNALEEGADEYDFLHGAEEYKFHWARESRDLARLELYPPGARGLCFRAMTGGRHLAREWSRRVFGKRAANNLETNRVGAASSVARSAENEICVAAASGEEH
jgi:CelD/BcsL family acetyltransferase involved in cellulose biosynthesis